jgi:hypothetical protein
MMCSLQPITVLRVTNKTLKMHSLIRDNFHLKPYEAVSVSSFFSSSSSSVGVRLSPLGTPATNWPRVIDDECGAVGGMRIGRGNRNTTPVPLCSPQIPHDLTSTRARAAAMEAGD